VPRASSVNPYQPPRDVMEPTDGSVFQFIVPLLLVVAALACLAGAFCGLLGSHGNVMVLDAFVLLLAEASVSKRTKLMGIPIPKMNAVEFIVLVAICVEFHLLCLPAVVSGCHRLRAAPTQSSSALEAPTPDAVDGDRITMSN